MEKKETKLCKYCQTEIPSKAKVCPNCKRKQGGIGCLGVVLLVLGVFIFIGSFGSSMSKDKNPEKVGEVQTESQDQNSQTEEPVSNTFNVGDVVETDNFRITYESTGEYKSDNEFLQPKDGCVYWEFKFKFENISDTDQSVSTMMDWECYTDNSKADQTWIVDDNGLDGKLSAGREAEGAVYFEVPEDAENIELEYDINFWQSDKIIFVGK